MGDFYYYGIDVEWVIEKAKKYYRMAAKKRDYYAKQQLNIIQQLEEIKYKDFLQVGEELKQPSTMCD